MKINWVLVIGILLFWLYPWFVINIELLFTFIKYKDLIKGSKKNKKIAIRESIGEMRYLIPLFNWFLMYGLFKGREFIEAYVKGKLEKNIEKKPKATEK